MDIYTAFFACLPSKVSLPLLCSVLIWLGDYVNAAVGCCRRRVGVEGLSAMVGDPAIGRGRSAENLGLVARRGVFVSTLLLEEDAKH